MQPINLDVILYLAKSELYFLDMKMKSVFWGGYIFEPDRADSLQLRSMGFEKQTKQNLQPIR